MCPKKWMKSVLVLSVLLLSVPIGTYGQFSVKVSRAKVNRVKVPQNGGIDYSLPPPSQSFQGMCRSAPARGGASRFYYREYEGKKEFTIEDKVNGIMTATTTTTLGLAFGVQFGNGPYPMAIANRGDYAAFADTGVLYVTFDSGLTWNFMPLPDVTNPGGLGYTYDWSMPPDIDDVKGSQTFYFDSASRLHVVWVGQASQAAGNQERYALIHLELPHGFDPNNPPSAEIVDTFDGDSTVCGFINSCWINMAVDDDYMIVVTHYGTEGSVWFASLRQYNYYTYDLNNSQWLHHGYIGEGFFDITCTQVLPFQRVLEDEVNIVPAGNGKFGFLRRMGLFQNANGQTRDNWAVSMLQVDSSGKLPDTESCFPEALTDLNTQALAENGIGSADLRNVLWDDDPNGNTAMLLGVSAPLYGNAIDVFTFAPPANGGVVGDFNAIMRYRYVPGSTVVVVQPNQLVHLEDYTQAMANAKGESIIMSYHGWRSYNGTANKTVTTFCSDIIGSGGGFTHGLHLTDES